MSRITEKLGMVVALLAVAGLVNTSQAQVLGVPLPGAHSAPGNSHTYTQARSHSQPQAQIKKKMVYSVTVTVQNIKSGQYSQVHWDFTTHVWNGTAHAWNAVNFHSSYNLAVQGLCNPQRGWRFISQQWHNHREVIGTW